jgi:hypothetical protein
VFEGFEALGALCADGGDRQHGWEFVRALAAAVGRPLRAGDGVDPSEVREAEDRLGFGIPAALREAYLLFGGRRPDLTRGMGRLVPPHLLQVDADGVLVFRWEHQGSTSWGVPVASAGWDDPPVVVEGRHSWVAYSDRLSIALVEMVLSEMMFSVDEWVVDNCALVDEASHAAVSAAFNRLPLPDFPTGFGASIRWFVGPDVLVRDDCGTWLWVLGRTSAAVQAVRDSVPGDWQMGSDIAVHED